MGSPRRHLQPGRDCLRAAVGGPGPRRRPGGSGVARRGRRRRHGSATLRLRPCPGRGSFGSVRHRPGVRRCVEDLRLGWGCRGRPAVRGRPPTSSMAPADPLASFDPDRGSGGDGRNLLFWKPRHARVPVRPRLSLDALPSARPPAPGPPSLRGLDEGEAPHGDDWREGASADALGARDRDTRAQAEADRRRAGDTGRRTTVDRNGSGTGPNPAGAPHPRHCVSRSTRPSDRGRRCGHWCWRWLVGVAVGAAATFLLVNRDHPRDGADRRASRRQGDVNGGAPPSGGIRRGAKLRRASRRRRGAATRTAKSSKTRAGPAASLTRHRRGRRAAACGTGPDA